KVKEDSAPKISLVTVEVSKEPSKPEVHVGDVIKTQVPEKEPAPVEKSKKIGIKVKRLSTVSMINVHDKNKKVVEEISNFPFEDNQKVRVLVKFRKLLFQPFESDRLVIVESLKDPDEENGTESNTENEEEFQEEELDK
ncbi:3640_t:CDS:2, partial [Diversispora eburnea]